MRNLIFILLSVNLVFSSCINNNASNSKINIPLKQSREYYSDDEGSLLVCIEKKDSLISIYEFYKNDGLIRKLSVNTYTNRLSIVSRDYLQQNISSESYNTAYLPSSYATHFNPVDSTEFWNEVIRILDLFTFELPRDKSILDFSYSDSKHEDQTIILNTTNFNKNIAIRELDQLPKLFFQVHINQEGNITKVEYNSWGSEIYDKIIKETKKILVSKSIGNYRILQQPVKVKTPVGVIVKPDKLPLQNM